MSSMRAYLEKMLFVTILILFYCKAYFAFPNILIKQTLLFSIFIVVFQYVGAGIIFAKIFNYNWIETLFYTQLPTVMAILFHFSINYNVLTNVETVLFFSVYIFILPLISALSSFLYIKYLQGSN